ncbi:major histocompatibility complex class I-related gene protein-like [Sparus aurata]|uniref:major histocompatibility complex class I-related gene protein-like n=1 Tax=Sparus aurata TaxID=8175 RepID=UPI0011C13349|nr:major histocompatibility complex class I-related gene protein-like [Sparus aurata]
MTNNSKQLIQLGPSLTRLHQIKMRTLLLLLLFCHVSSPVLHSRKYFITASTGISNLPGFIATLEIDELLVVYCDNNKNLDVKLNIAKLFFKLNPEELNSYKQNCFQDLPNTFLTFLYILMSLFIESEDVHVLQHVHGLEWDDETEEVKVFAQFGYDGEDLLEWDPNSFTWIAQRPEADIVKEIMDADKALRNFFEVYVAQNYLEWLKNYVKYGRSFLLRTGFSRTQATLLLGSCPGPAGSCPPVCG